MNTVNHSIIRPLKSALSLLLTAAIAVSTVACDESRDPAATVRYADLGGEDLYMGVFFGIGPAADLLPEVHALSGRTEKSGKDVVPLLRRAEQRMVAAGDADAAARVHQVIADIEDGIDPIADLEQHDAVARWMVAEIERKNPGFFAEFARELTSRDPVRVDAVMRRAAERTRDATGNVLGASDFAAPTEQQHLAGLFLVAVIALAVAIWSVAAVVEAVAITDSDAGGKQYDDPLWRDELIARLTVAAAR